MDTSLLIVAHGSRRVASNQEIATLAATVKNQSPNHFLSVEYAFLEIAEPSISQGIDNCIQQGAKKVLVMPYFLSAGRHVVTDIPDIVAERQQHYPDLQIKLLPYLGAAQSIPTLILNLARGDDV